MKKLENYIVSVFSGENEVLNKVGWLIVNVCILVGFVAVCFLFALVLLK